MTDAPRLDPARPLAAIHTCPVYAASPLRLFDIEDRRIAVKDETARMGLGAFKALGGVYAVGCLIAEAAGLPFTGETAKSPAMQAQAARMTFVCASAGNHGMAVASGARLFGARARIHLSDTVPEDFAMRLRAKGAEVVRSGAVYEESIAAAIEDAATTGAIHLADGSWPGYTEPPRLVMEGYTVMAEEMRAAFEASGDWPSHVYLQAGVGGLAAAVAARIRASWSVQPRIVVVEPDAAPCLRDSVAAGQILSVEGPVSVMGRLDCKTPSLLAYDILRDATDEWVTVTDAEAEAAARLATERGLPTTPSGAAGLAACLAADPAPERPLVVVSEGAVDD